MRCSPAPDALLFAFLKRWVNILLLFVLGFLKMARRARGKAKGVKGSPVNKIQKWLKEGSNAVIAVLAVVVVVVLAFMLFSGGGEETPASNVPYTPPTTPLIVDREMDNVIRFGWNHRGEYDAHNFICTTCCCDESRKDYVYVSVGYIEFDLKTTLNATFHELVIIVGNLNENCRRNNVLVDGNLIGNLNRPANGPDKTEWKFNITPAGEVVHVRIEHLIENTEECWWGNDVFGARIYARK